MTKCLGFTGTRNGLTNEQRRTLFGLLQDEKPDEVVHGDCIGADEQFDHACAVLDIPRGIRPCTFENMRAHCEGVGARVISEPVNPMQRNRDIVAQSQVLIGCPPNDTMLKKGSGTWATIRYGLKAGITVHVILPNGKLWRP